MITSLRFTTARLPRKSHSCTCNAGANVSSRDGPSSRGTAVVATFNRNSFGGT